MRVSTLFLAAAAGAASVGAASAQTKWQMPTAYPPGNFHTINVVKFVDEVKQATGGKLEIVVHPGASLLPLPQIKRNVQTGDVQMGEILFSALENEDAIFGVDTVPFLVTGYDAAKKLWDASKPVLAKKLEAQGVRLLYSVPWPPQGLYANKPIARVEDLKGLKFRSYGPSAARFGEMVGVSVSTIQAAELSQALATGRVNSMITSSVTGVDSKIWETDVKYYYELDAWLPKNAVLVNERAFQGLDAASRDAVLKAAAAAETRGWEESQKASGERLAMLRQNGMKVEKPSPQLAEGLKKIGAQMAADWEKNAGADGARLLAPFK